MTIAIDSNPGTRNPKRVKVRVATYNIHRCRGLDRRVRPDRIVEVLREIDAEIVGLQEVLSIPNHSREKDQARFIAEELEMNYSVGWTRTLKGGVYGNVVLSRFPLIETRNYDISVRGREQRGCLRADIAVGGQAGVLHVFNVHLGTAYLERRYQARKLIDNAILNHEELKGARIMLGDFNEWTRGLATKLFASHMVSADIKLHLQQSRTYPGVFPLLHLDHIYFDPELHLHCLTLHRSRTALVASDHLPLVADFRL
ncbi:MAG TPA: endonuclease/exonuclease/phosphatase family protein [Blastocatellia bacterium]|nr:endonuclease/exonuclease/phosphatase family protein [Blastocatellia bacterium]